jgi:hypothetical protein
MSNFITHYPRRPGENSFSWLQDIIEIIDGIVH